MWRNRFGGGSGPLVRQNTEWMNIWGWRNTWAWSMIDCKDPSVGVWDVSIVNLPTCDISMTMRCKRRCHDTGNSYSMCLNNEWLFWTVFQNLFLRTITERNLQKCWTLLAFLTLFILLYIFVVNQTIHEAERNTRGEVKRFFRGLKSSTKVSSHPRIIRIIWSGRIE